MHIDSLIHIIGYTLHITCFLPIGIYHCYLLYSSIKKDKLCLDAAFASNNRRDKPLQPVQPVPKNAIEFIKVQEGFRANKYLDLGGKSTIGYGETNYLDDIITHAKAEELLISRLQVIIEELGKLVIVPLNENQISGLLSFIYNVGIGAFTSSTLLKKINVNDHIYTIQSEWLKWKYVNKIEFGALKNRRMLEFNLYTQPITTK